MSISLFRGTLVNPSSPEHLEVKPKSTIAVEDGIIQAVYSQDEPLPGEYLGLPIADFKDSILIPAFTDLHIHAPQYVERGTGMDCLLFDWLNNYTFPQEAKFQNVDYARVIYAQLIRDMLKNGTMHANFFTTIHYDACDLFFRMLEESGMYAFSGKINMDMNSPEYYVEDTGKSLEETERFHCEHTGAKRSGRVQNILIPRFAPTCSEPLLKGLGRLAEKYGLGLHT
ncbi:MAG: amidohydrolase family protein, partial [Oscillospiraceae bacterium]|nr:amidohydrolase family protein [Oscillospiraceae bacterium]